MILDCTLRDGGYYTNWDWSDGLVSDYLFAMGECGADIVELGFRGEEGGLYANLPDYVISQLDPEPRVAIMLNTARLRNVSDLSTHLAPAKCSPVDIVRLATHIEDLDRVGPYIARVKEMGYECWLNIMQAPVSGFFPPCRPIPRRWGEPDMIVFADSLGESDAGDDLRWLCGAKFGYHPHNNLGQATGEAERALNSWAACVDSSVCGLGRGAGNARTELLVETIPQSLVDLCADIEAMRPELGWGPSPLYAYAARQGIHPTYVQKGATLDELRNLHGKRRYGD
jgi:4-hydroxy 2-oxovalerate aldolase